MASVTATLSPGASAALSPAPHATQHITSTAANIRARDAALAAAIITTMYERACHEQLDTRDGAARESRGGAGRSRWWWWRSSERTSEGGFSLFLLRTSARYSALALADIRLCACARFYLLLISRPPEPLHHQGSVLLAACRRRCFCRRCCRCFFSDSGGAWRRRIRDAVERGRWR